MFLRSVLNRLRANKSPDFSKLRVKKQALLSSGARSSIPPARMNREIRRPQIKPIAAAGELEEDYT